MDDIWKMIQGGAKPGELICLMGKRDVGKTRFDEQMLLEMIERGETIVYLDYEGAAYDFTSKLQER